MINNTLTYISLFSSTVFGKSIDFKKLEEEQTNCKI